MELVVVVDGGDAVVLMPDEPLAWGRLGDPGSSVIGLDPLDRGISRRALEAKHSEPGWVLTNTSSSQPVYVDRESAGPLATLPPGGRHLIDGSTTGVEVRGTLRTHRIEFLQRCPPRHTGSQTRLPLPRTDATEIAVTDAERLALVAVYRGYLEDFPRRDCEPLSYRAAGNLLGLPEVTVRRRIERYRARLRREGVYIEGRSARFQLGSYLIERRIIGPPDLHLLEV